MERGPAPAGAGLSDSQLWGAFVAGQLESIVGLNATAGDIGQVGGVYTRPATRGRGLARRAMRHLLADCATRLGFTRIILFTGESNVAARRLYEGLGFEHTGDYALLFA